MLPHWLNIVKLFYEKSCIFHFLGYGYDGNKFITCHANLRIHNTYNIVLSNKDIIPLIYNLCKYSNVTVILQLLCSIITSICLIISIFFLWILLLFPIYYFVSLNIFILISLIAHIPCLITWYLSATIWDIGKVLLITFLKGLNISVTTIEGLNSNNIFFKVDWYLFLYINISLLESLSLSSCLYYRVIQYSLNVGLMPPVL